MNNDSLQAYRDKLRGTLAIVRTARAGVFAGTIDCFEGSDLVLLDARRLWYWSGAASLSQLSQEGVKDPDDCKFPCKVPLVILLEVIEILPLSDRAWQSIEEVPVWAVQ
jgi:hypothetical protein